MQRIKSFNERISAALKSPGKIFKKSAKVTATPPSAPPKPLPKGYRIVERYPLYEPFAHAAIAKNPVTGEFKYILDELRLDILEKNIYDRILEILLAEIASPEAEIEDPRQFFVNEAEKIVGKYRISLGWLPDVSWSKILYHAQRNLVGFGRIDALMRDPNIEDISCDGVEKPVYIWHRRYENLETNLIFHDDQEVDDAVVKLVHMAGKHVSSAFPIVDASLPGKHRLAVCYRREVTPFGTAFTIRKFRDDPYSIIDLINLGTLSEKMAAYFWTCLENRASLMVLGGTASGKTTFLNAVACLVKPGSKIITIEETAELNMPHENWVSLIARRSYGLGESLTGEVTLFDLVKTAMRHRPDLIMVGEIRGSEAYTLFQALATGHGGMATMHADSVESAVKRLIQKPMDIAPAYMSLMNIVVSIQRVHLPQSKTGEMTAYRRVLNVNEIADYEDYRETFTWKAAGDVHESNFKTGVMLNQICERRGMSWKELVEQIEQRENVLKWMRGRNIRSYRDVASVIAEYNAKPEEFYEKEVLASATAKNT
ncbi:MAG: type II/IV secretion system ATPase subunit [Candidatus Bathyarchaeota archaeon]|nr:type II/IV secretion system ATPase subunit [Candidatus Bathyarchaeum tardum]WGM89139.1 MAG: type II/IV secretion system ATPase subunit [Candidatus Bathyarchaeum tardum]WNZ28621.1 MAG: type II/IV secretion system ATPase subunit [Candidatus Bathyarchaeota archaeon]